MIRSVNISVWIPMSFRCFTYSMTDCGILPIPSSTVQPSSMSEAQYSPICRLTSVVSAGGTSNSGSLQGMMQSKS